mgnify:FL=1
MKLSFVFSLLYTIYGVFSITPGTIPDEPPTIGKYKAVLDANWRWLHYQGGYQNCFDGSWKCGNECDNCVLEGVTANQYKIVYGISENNNQLELQFITENNVGSRLYLLENNKYWLPNLLNKQISIDIDVSELPCSLNAAVYLVQMNSTALDNLGVGYGDAQCPTDIKYFDTGKANTNKSPICSVEIDLIETNSESLAWTLHPCDGNQCDKSGADANSYRQGYHNFYGKGKTIDTNHPFTVITQFIGDPLTEVKRYYKQNDKIIEHPGGSLTSESIQKWKTLQQEPHTFELYGGFDSLTKAIKQGMTFIISIWDDQATHMTWLDSGDRGPCQPNFNVRHTSPNVKARFSNIVLEDIVNYPHNECDSQNKCQVKHRQLPLKLVKCVDNPNYRDPYWGDSCTQWASYSCTGQSFSNELMQACPVACKICTPSTQMPVPATPLPIPSTGSTSVSSVNTGSISTTMQSVLNRHNKYRCMHGVPLMTWDPVIAANAQAWADMSMGVMKHSPHTSRSNIGGFWALGENLALGVTDAVAVDLWYSEISNTNGGMVSDFSPSTGHYSQVIWKDSITLGCGVYNKLIVCQYGPAGNSGDYTQVTPPIPGKVCSDGGVV